DRVAIALNRGHDDVDIALPTPRAGLAWRILLDSSALDRRDWDIAPEEKPACPARTSMILAESAPQPRGARASDPALVDKLAEAAGIAGEWWDIEGKRTIVGRETKIALLKAFRLPAATNAEARDSLQRLVDERQRRPLPFSFVARDGESAYVPLRLDPKNPNAPPIRLNCEGGREIALAPDVEAQRVTLADGHEIVERRILLPALPIGRHKLIAGDAACDLAVAPAKAHLPDMLRRRVFGVSAQLYAQRRLGDQGIGDFSTLGRLGAAAGAAGAALLGVNPLHMLFAQDRERASPYHPSDRRFLDPIHVDALDGVLLPSDAGFVELALERAQELAGLARAGAVDYPRVWRVKSALLESRFAAFRKARAAQPRDPLFAEYDRFIAAGGETLERFACFQALAEERRGEDWRQWPDDLRDGAPAALRGATERLRERVDYHAFLQWLADRQLAGAASRGKAGGLSLGLYRDLAIGAAPDGAEAWARAHELGQGVSVGAPPDPFSRDGQIWHLPPPDPLAMARDAWRGFSALLAANMRHAGLLRLDHAMGLTRLFLVPDGAKPSDGAYVSYPLQDLIGLLALESRNNQCAVVGEDLGTVPEGFREKLTEAGIFGMRVLWFEKDDDAFRAPAAYPALAVACAATHDLPTVAGWWAGADIAERKALGLIGAESAQSQIEAREREKRALAEALVAAGLLREAPDPTAPASDALAAAIHAFVARAPSLVALAQADDLAGETIAPNLPGTDRQRPNWRRKLPDDAGALFSSARAQAIIAALKTERP
ncbi:MAG TPA: 4-alpha-glucanotransferase, partial [Roseiarcus sp.]|nr:4-alpha-glucanotransferase [Roseiarcus sp.]